jgi:DNA-binding NarL/FixJ family response regulator
MTPTAPHFLLVDDHALFRMGLAQMLTAHWPQARLHQAVSWAGALALLTKLLPEDPPDAIVLDVGLPDVDALPLLGDLRQLAPEVPLMVMSADSRPERVALARQAGARGWIAKSAQAGEIIDALAALLRGEQAFAGLGYDSLVGGASLSVPSPAAVAREASDLTDLQLQILRLLGREVPNKAIARQLGLSETDVRVQVSWLTEMLHASSRQEAYSLAVERGVLSP